MECTSCPGLGHGPSPGTGVWAQPHPVTWSASEKGDSPKENQGLLLEKGDMGRREEKIALHKTETMIS